MLQMLFMYADKIQITEKYVLKQFASYAPF